MICFFMISNIKKNCVKLSIFIYSDAISAEVNEVLSLLIRAIRVTQLPYLCKQKIFQKDLKLIFKRKLGKAF